MTLSDFFVFFGFVLAAYSIVANDAIQTLGTFLSSNVRRPWWVLWLYACSILVAVLLYGWFTHYGDVSYGRLQKFPLPAGGITWIHAIPPIFILLLTRFGVPVSTTFLILTVFAPSNLQKMLTKSLTGYVLAIAVGLAIYLAVSRVVERYFISTRDREPSPVWIALQWCSTAFLWSQWLIQDLANIFIYLPRALSVGLLAFAVAVMLALHAYIFYQRGGAIQGIITDKTNTTDIRSATIIDFIYAFILFYFKQVSNVPMSTTWVFLGLLAGREFAFSILLKHRSLAQTGLMVAKDAGKATIGLAVSVALAFGLPLLAERMAKPSGPATTASAKPADAPAADTTAAPRARIAAAALSDVAPNGLKPE